MNPNYLLAPYDEGIKKILTEGFLVEGDRTNVGTLCTFGISTEYDISQRVPVLTKRAVAWKSIVKEVLWYISGSHSINDLENMGCKIWTPWKNKDFTNKHLLPEGSGGYIYGFNLIHFGADIDHVESLKRLNKHGYSVKEGFGFNQLDYVINTLKENPKSRQACFTFWRPDTNHKAILPACHAFYSFNASPDQNGDMTVLNCHLFQRSADWFVGVGMGNLWTATLFTYMIAQQVGMTPGKVFHTGANCHIYLNAKDVAEEYLKREETPNSPILYLNKRSSIYDYTVDDFVLEDYNPLPKMKVPIAV